MMMGYKIFYTPYMMMGYKIFYTPYMMMGYEICANIFEDNNFVATS